MKNRKKLMLIVGGLVIIILVLLAVGTTSFITHANKKNIKVENRINKEIPQKTELKTGMEIKTTKVASKAKVNESDWVAKLKVAQTTNQLVTVQVYNFKQAIVQYHVKTDGVWKQVFSTNQGWIGYGGLTNPVGRKEGNGTTPTGVYTFGTAFGAQPNPGTVFTYNRLQPDSYWDADFGTPLFNHYNTWNPGSNWNKAGAEPLWANEAVAYQYAISINYNTFNPHQGWGNAIFLHCTVGGGTAGCVGIPEQDVVYLLQHLDKQAKIVISTKDGIYNY